MGVMHGDEIEYVFGHPLNMSIEYNDKERELSLHMMQAYARFALSGKPVAEDAGWPLYTREEPQYYIFNAEKSGMGKGPRSTACAFWNHFLPLLASHEEAGDVGCLGDTHVGSGTAATGRRPHLITGVGLLLLLATRRLTV